MNKERVLEAVKTLIDECSSSSCEYCDFCNAKGDCVLSDELITTLFDAIGIFTSSIVPLFALSITVSLKNWRTALVVPS